MFELLVKQKRNYKEELILYFEKSQFEEMCNLMQSIMKASKHEVDFLIREIEEGQVEEDED